MAANRSSTHVVYVSLVGNILVVVTKFAAAIWTGSASMLSEAVHSLIDSANGLLLLYGLRRASRAPDSRHPLGYGREVYFWSFMVALLMFSLGAGVAMFEGIRHVLRPSPIDHPFANYIVLGLSLLFEAGTWYVSWKQFRASKGDLSYWQATRRSKDPPSFMVLIENTTDVIGLLVALAGIAASELFDAPVLDGVASVLIGAMLAVTALILARETKELLIGERADPEIVQSILRLAAEEPGVSNANGVFTVHLAPDQIAVALSLEFADELTAPEIEERVISLEKKVRAAHPEVTAIFIKPQSQGHFRERQRVAFGG